MSFISPHQTQLSSLINIDVHSFNFLLLMLSYFYLVLVYSDSSIDSRLQKLTVQKFRVLLMTEFSKNSADLNLEYLFMFLQSLFERKHSSFKQPLQFFHSLPSIDVQSILYQMHDNLNIIVLPLYRLGFNERCVRRNRSTCDSS